MFIASGSFYLGGKRMSIIFGSARSNENGKATGGKAGDNKQTSSTNDTIGEVSMQPFYVHIKGWLVFNWVSIDFSTAAALQMKFACNNSNIGYCQDHKTSLFNYVKKNKIKSLDKVDILCEVDCSTLIRTIIYIVTGIDIGDITTATEPKTLKASGLFEESYEYVSQDDTPVYNGSITCTKTKGHTGIIVSGNPRKNHSQSGKETYYPKYTGKSSSIVDALASVGESDTSKSHRVKIASANGISGYTGTSSQNTKMLLLLKAGKLLK
jgi:hypothetical protein